MSYKQTLNGMVTTNAYPQCHQPVNQFFALCRAQYDQPVFAVVAFRRCAVVSVAPSSLGWRIDNIQVFERI
jgi:hypothetical protein